MPEAPEGYRVADLSALDDEDPRAVRVASFDDLPDPGDLPDLDGAGGRARDIEATDAVPDVERYRVADLGSGSEDGEAAGPAGTGDGEAGPAGDGPVRVASFDGFAAGTRGRRGRRGTGGTDAATRPRRAGPAGAHGGAVVPPAGTGDGTGDGDGTDDVEDGARPERRARRDGSTGRGRRTDRTTGARTTDRTKGGRANGPGAPADAPPTTPAEQQARAKEICLRLLTDRARTVKELRDALARKEIPDDVADAVLERFDEVGLVDDAAFADQWVRSRHRHRGLGRRAIAVELRRKGVDTDTAAEALTGIDDDAERDRARELVTRRLRGLPIGSREERQSAARKLVGMLARKGYGPNVAYGVVREEIAAAGADADELGDEPPDEH